MATAHQRYPELGWLLGVTEMETAVAVLLDKAATTDTPFGDVMISAAEIKECSASTVAGFMLLAMDGYLQEHLCYHSIYYASQSLVERMRTRECWQNLADPKTEAKILEEFRAKFCESPTNG